MRKIPTLFKRDPENMARVTAEVHPDCQWVLDGEGAATRKYDGTCVMLDAGGEWWARREVKPGKTPPPNFVPVTTDETTGKTMGWEPIKQSPFAKFHAEALGAGGFARSFLPGTYELIGPKVQGNPEKRDHHELVPHGLETIRLFDFQPDFEDVREALRLLGEDGWEGVVWHHPDGRMAKLKGRDFGTSPCTRVEERGSA